MAYELCKIIHRDVSGNNIMITNDGRGIMLDFDLSRPATSDKYLGPRQRERTVSPLLAIIFIANAQIGYLVFHVGSSPTRRTK